MRYPQPQRWSRREFLSGLIWIGAAGWLGLRLRPAVAGLTETAAARRTKVIALGGGAGHAIDWMMQARIQGVQVMAADTDWQALRANLTPHKIPLRTQSTRALETEIHPKIGQEAALRGSDALTAALGEADLVVILAGLGGVKGTGAATMPERSLTSANKNVWRTFTGRSVTDGRRKLAKRATSERG